jgi:hypothetical protein
MYFNELVFIQISMRNDECVRSDFMDFENMLWYIENTYIKLEIKITKLGQTAKSQRVCNIYILN